MSIQAVAWALDQDLPARPKLVLVSIANHANHTDGYCWLNAETIAQEASCSPRGVFNFVGDLIRNGYVRKAPKRGQDGKQRANDYWISLGRQTTEWSPRSPNDHEGPEDIESEEPNPDNTDEYEPHDVEKPDAPRSCGKNATEPVDNHVYADGPHAPACRHIDSLEPSKPKPKEVRARGAVPRHYRPPPVAPPDPIASVAGANAEWIFVFKPSRAYDAWATRRRRDNGRPFNMECWRNGRMGWYFPSLFPPDDGTEGTSAKEIEPFT